MELNKKLLLSFLALSSTLPVYSAGSGKSTAVNEDRLYNNMIKNLEQGKSNEKSYKLLERIFKQKNKELKDLYYQSDYIVKPEYLEWQIFAAGFYEEYGKGVDNTKNNARYDSKVTGYYNENGYYVVTDGSDGKPYQPQNQPKGIDFGVDIAMKGISRNITELAVTPADEVSITPNIISSNIEIPKITGNIELQTFSPINAVTPPDLSKISINWPRAEYTYNGQSHANAVTANVNGTDEVNSGNLIYNVNSSSGLMNKTGIELYKGSYTNDGKIEINYDGMGNSGGGVTSTNTFHGILNENRYFSGPQNSNPISFINNGEFNIYTNLADNGGDVGSVMGIHYYSGSYAENTKIENYGTVRVKQAVWMQFEDTEGTYLSHSSDGRVGNVIADESSQGLQIWRCCYVDYRDNDTLAYIDPGIIVVRGESTGINIVESEQGMRSEVVNDNQTGDASKDSQLIIESGNGLVFTISDNLKTGLYEEVNIPIYQTGAGTNGLIVIDGTSNGAPGWSTGGRGKGVVHLGTGAKIEIRTPGNMTSRTTGIYTNAAQAIDNEGTVSNITSDTYSVTLNDGTILNYDAQPDGSKNTVGVYITRNNGMSLNTEVLPGEVSSNIHFRQNGGSIRIGGENSVALYNNSDVVKITNNAEIEAVNGAVGLYTKGNGTAGSAVTIIDNANLTVGDKSLLFYNEAGGQVDFQGTTTALVKSGGTAFYSKGTTALTDYLNIGNFTVKMEENSTLLMLEEPLIPVYLSSLPGVTGINIDPASSTNYKKVSQYRGNFYIDKNVSLDNPTDDYVQTSLISTKTELMSGYTIAGNNAGQVGIKSGANTSIITNTDVSAINNGVINLSGNNSAGLYTNYGTNTNNTTLNVTGTNGVGIFAENGSAVSNSGNITIGNKGVGIYAVSFQDEANEPLFGDKKINVTNTGQISANAGTQAVGIYLNNNKGLATSDAVLNLGTGAINVKDSDSGIGVYADKIKISGAGTITVGKNGVGIYAKDSDLYLNGIGINLHGDNSLGLYLDGNTNLWTGNGNIDVNGQNVVLFSMNTDSGTTVNNDFTISSTAGSTYTIGNISQSRFTYTGNSNLASNGTFISGKNSAVYLDGATITADSGAVNTAAIALDGQYAGTLPAGMTANIDGENNGNIYFGDSSVGVYGKNGSRLSNRGIITVGNNSAALMTSGTGSFAENKGAITIGAGSQGIVVKDGTDIRNISGIISGTEMGSVGIYSDNITGSIENGGIINLSGDKALGIYSAGSNAVMINNNSGAEIKIGDSSDNLDPSIGIYSAAAGSTVTNNGTVETGVLSVGIYNNGGTVINNNAGVITAGDSGVGIYSINGAVNLNTGSVLNLGTNGTIGVYGISSAVANSADLNIKDHNYGFIMKNGSFVNNAGTNGVLGTDSVFMYSTEATTVQNDGNLTMTGSDNIGFYMDKDSVSGTGGGIITNNGIITGTAGNNNVGIYNYGGTIDNYGNVAVGGSDLVFIDGTTDIDGENSKYAVGLYGENSAVINRSGGIVSAGYGGYGIVAYGGTANNYGKIITNGDYSRGMYTENGVIINETGGIIDVTGESAIGMAGKGADSKLINNGIINVSGNNAVGIYGRAGAVIINTGEVNVTGNGTAFVSDDPGNSENSVNGGTITVNGIMSSNVISGSSNAYALPALINAGIIRTDGVLALEGTQVLIKPDLSTRQASADPDYDFVISGTSLIADEILTSKPIVIMPGFADGTNADVYKLEGLIKAKSGHYDFVSGSLLWEATPRVTASGADIYMERKSFTDFTEGLWFEDFGTALENNYATATGDGVTIYNKTGYIADEQSFRQITASLAGNVYANINQRENDIVNAFENSLHLMQNSANNTKENVKVNVITGKGKNKEETDGVTGYDYTTAGVLALREVERTYRHTFGYSLGYLHTGFEFNDGNESEEWVDTIQLGVHNKYKADSWIVRNDLTGRASIHNVDRNIDWPSPLGRSEMNGTYETYSITSDNILGKEFELGKKASIMPYGAFRAMYVTRPTFNESGLEALEVEGNDAWSAKPRAGIELKGALPLGTTSGWQLKGALDVAYEYELADLNEREKARLIAIEDGYHNLSKPQDEEGTFRTRASVGVEVEDRYGIFLTGEYSTGNNKENDYRTGVTFKAVF